MLFLSTDQKHTYHLVDQSPWPLLTSFSVMNMLLGAVMYMHLFSNGLFLFLGGLLVTLLCAGLWWRDIVREATFEGRHTLLVQKGLRMGMALFIVSEIMFFFAFFWAFFHSSAAPSVEIGAIWPPAGIEPFNAFGIPLLNTLILLLSGATLTWAHHSITAGDKWSALEALDFTIYLAILFSAFQAYEYIYASFSISDGVYGSVFYLATGFHGFHVIVGTVFLYVCYSRLSNDHFTKEHHFGFVAAAWYWHFVDVVWLFLYLSVYWWGGC